MRNRKGRAKALPIVKEIKMYNIDELKKEAERLQKQGTPYLGKVLYEDEEKKIVVRPYFGGNAEKGLYYLVNDGTEYSDIYYLSNIETGESEDLKEYIEKLLPMEIKRKQARIEAEEKQKEEAAKRAEYERFHGFTDSMNPMKKGRTVKVLEKRLRYREGIMTRAEWIEGMVKRADTYTATVTDVGEYRLYYKINEMLVYNVVTKTEIDYFNYLKGDEVEELIQEAESIINKLDTKAHSKLYDACVKAISNAGWEVLESKTMSNRLLASLVVDAIVDVTLLGDEAFTEKMYDYYDVNFPWL